MKRIASPFRPNRQRETSSPATYNTISAINNNKKTLPVLGPRGSVRFSLAKHDLINIKYRSITLCRGERLGRLAEFFLHRSRMPHPCVHLHVKPWHSYSAQLNAFKRHSHQLLRETHGRGLFAQLPFSHLCCCCVLYCQIASNCSSTNGCRACACLCV